MKIAVSIVRAVVGILFIVSGLVKANDPLGLSYKMQEFFELWNTSLSSSNFFLSRPIMALFEYFHDHSLMLSVIMIALEILAGAALILGWQKKLILRSLLALIVFFTFLTAYAYLSGKFKNCGCFGDCLPITPLTSFLKDIALLVFIVFLLFTQRYIEPLFSNAGRRFMMLCALAVSVGLQWYVLNYLPLVDCLPFKKGNNISQQMKIPAGALPDSFAIRFVYEKEGKKFEFSPETLPSDLATYKYVDRIDKLVRKGKAEAPIKGFSLAGATSDSTEIVLNQAKALLVVCDVFKDSESRLNDLKIIKEAAQQKKIPVYIVTSASIPVVTNILNNNGLGDIQVFSCDNTAVRTAARTNPTFYILQQGTVVSKYSYCQAGKTISDLKKR